jgi:hypothetical protein
MMHFEHINLRFKRVPAAIGAFIFGIAAGFFLDAVAYGHVNIDLKPIWIWLAFYASAFSALVCLKNAVFPNLIFEADISGIKIGRGLIINKIHHIPWRNLNKIEESTIRITGNSANSGHMRPREVPALKLLFDDSVDLGRLGYKMARPKERKSYLIAKTILDKPLPETIDILKKMKSHFT